MKQCISCSEYKKLTEFLEKRTQCKVCRNKQRLARPKKVYQVSLNSKLCKCCNTEKQASDFNKDSTRVGGLTAYCNSCRSTKNKNRYTQNPDKKKQNSKQRYLKIKGTEDFNKKRRVYRKEKEESSLTYKLSRRLRNRLYYALKNKNWKKDTHFSEYIGCDYETLINHLEVQFTLGMNWDNYGKWHIDHIKPLSSATSPEEMYALCHYTNLQPLWALDNIKKGDKSE